MALIGSDLEGPDWELQVLAVLDVWTFDGEALLVVELENVDDLGQRSGFPGVGIQVGEDIIYQEPAIFIHVEAIACASVASSDNA